MPRRDGTGPTGMGALTGRGVGACGTGVGRGMGKGIGRGIKAGCGLGLGVGLGLGLGRLNRRNNAQNAGTLDEVEILESQLAQIKARLAALNKDSE